MAYDKVWERDIESLNNVERIKLKRDGLDVLETIVRKYSKQGLDSIPEDDRILLKWAGIYEQKPKNGSFMLRVRINSGKLKANQAKELAGISREYGKGFLRISTRGAIQFYNIKLEQLPGIFSRLEKVGLASYESCGDCPRTVIGNPLAGVDKYELMDTTELVNQVNDYFLLNRDFSNLPRKLKISISSSVVNPGNSEINDISFTPAVKKADGNEIIGFHLRVGGGLSTRPIMAKELDVFVLPGEVLDAAIGTAKIFRDYGYRQNRNHARLKFLVDDWGVEKFTEKLFEYTGKLTTRGIDKTIGWNNSYYYGVHEQKQEGKYYIGIHVPLGELNASELLELAQVSELYGDGTLRTTTSQNIIVTGIDNSNIDKVLKSSVLSKFSCKPETILANIVACTGSRFCNLSLTDTQSMALELASAIDDKFKLDLPIRISITGCPNSCGHVHIADIGLRAALIKTDSQREEAFDVFIGGKLGPGAQFGQKLKTRIRKAEAASCISSIIEYYMKERRKEELFHDFVRRQDISAFQALLSRS
ncbi:MAG: nitrite/sulfite reductase [Clostridiaceae bacterium]|nr:nitrite/sulfite reductase [Clostridiaceae bacterium]